MVQDAGYIVGRTVSASVRMRDAAMAAVLWTVVMEEILALAWCTGCLLLYTAYTRT